MILSDYEVRSVKDSSLHGTVAELHCTRCSGATLIEADTGLGHLGWPALSLAVIVAAANLHALDEHEREVAS